MIAHSNPAANAPVNTRTVAQGINPTALKPKITVIPATIDQHALNPLVPAKKRRVTAYARVSSDSEDQKTSYDAQVRFYTEHIKSNPDWEFVGMYADEGITGTNTKKRDEFNRMVDDALAGKIDLIITKSVSRFARNTVDSLVTVRKLKEKGVEVYFEKENIYSLDSKSEMILSFVSSIAQEESRNISTNVTWGHRRRMADGRVTIPYKRFLGYEKGEDGRPKIVESEAEIVRQIYDMFLDGNTYREVAASLTQHQIPTATGKSNWHPTTVKSMLANEKYAGNAILQKKFTVDYLTKTVKVNEGEVPQYYIEGSHPAIVSPETFGLAQSEIRRRDRLGKQLSGSGPFVCRIVCGICGDFYGRKIRHHGRAFQRAVWQCNRKYRNGNVCPSTHLSENGIQMAFINAFNQILAERDRLIPEYEAKMAELADSTDFDEQTARLDMECSEAAALAQDLISQNARYAQDQVRFKRELDALTLRSDTAKAKLSALKQERMERAALKEKIRRFISLLDKTPDPLTAFDEKIWRSAVESLAVRSHDDMTITFRSGTKIQTGVERK